jgi:hypothetical protein
MKLLVRLSLSEGGGKVVRDEYKTVDKGPNLESIKVSFHLEITKILKLTSLHNLLN